MSVLFRKPKDRRQHTPLAFEITDIMLGRINYGRQGAYLVFHRSADW